MDFIFQSFDASCEADHTVLMSLLSHDCRREAWSKRRWWAFVRLNVMGLLAVVFLAMGAGVLLWLIFLVLLFFFFSRALAFLGFSCSRLRDLCFSSDEAAIGASTISWFGVFRAGVAVEHH
jgi:hypothetical protein